MAYSKGIVTIPNVTGNIEIIVTTEEAAIRPIELYTGNAAEYQLNKKYSGNEIVDGPGYYLTDIMPVDFSVRPYLNIVGSYSANGTNADGSTAVPYVYKIGFYKGSICSRVEYMTNIGVPIVGTGFSVNMSNKSECDGIQLLIVPRALSGNAITASDVLSAEVFSAKISAEPLY